jgi:branched-chain amino acid transport system ATP-binding protein
MSDTSPTPPVALSLSKGRAEPVEALQVGELHAGYGRAEVLRGIRLQAAAGSVVTVIGPNGAGKSTLLNALMGVLPSRGAIRWQGRAVDALPLEARVDAGIALVPETRALFGSMPVEDNLRLGAWRLRQRGPRAAQHAMERVYALFPRLHERRAQLAGTLSGGERQMLAVGRALMGEPSLLMLDEPSLGLAPLVVREIFRTIAALRATGVTILLVEQNARAALEVADHAYVLEMGEIVLQGPAAELARDARVIDTYLGAARSNAPR